MVALSLAALVLTASPVPAVPLVRADPVPPVPVVRALAPRSAARVRLGAALEVGLPSGAQLSALLRAASWLQLEASLAHDGAAFGLAGGMTVGDFDLALTPTASVAVGHFFRGDLSGGLSRVVGVDISRYPSAKDFDFDHLDLQAGLLWGTQTVQVYLRGGVSAVHATLHHFQASLQTATGDSNLTAADPSLTAWVPSGRAGLSFFF